ncbi:MAG: DUF1311 domain-containing protein [Betaproteobacteria bacterium]|nr:DUF1311 domain-containing protein [Betaproteobacteria bacterium]
MQKFSKYCVIVSLTIFSVFSYAQDEEEYRKADKVLNEIYSTFIKSAGKENVQAIKTAQRAWIRYKEKHCNVNYDAVSESSVAPLNTYSCLRTETELRIHEIKRIMRVKKDPSDYERDEFSTILSMSETTADKTKLMISINNAMLEYADADWRKYVRATCAFSANYIEEDQDVCEARLNFIYVIVNKEI